MRAPGRGAPPGRRTLRPPVPYALAASVIATSALLFAAGQLAPAALPARPLSSPAVASLAQALLGWTAGMIALLAAVLACGRLRLGNDPAALVLVVALPLAALLDTAHAVITSGELLAATHGAERLLSATWVASRLSLALGVTLLAAAVGDGGRTRSALGRRWLTAACAAAAALVAAGFYSGLHRQPLARSLAPFHQPRELLLLGLFALAGLWVLPRLHRKQGSLMSLALIVSMVPQILCQTEVILATGQLSSVHLSLAHAQKLLGYVTLLAGTLASIVAGAMRREAVERAGVAERMKEELISSISHELRTPLTCMLGSLALLECRHLIQDPERAEELLAIARRNGERLLMLINGLLDLQKMAAGLLAFEMRPLEIQPLLAETMDGIRGFAGSMGVQLRLEPGPPALFVMSDRERLIQILFNLISNAIKLSPSGEEVVVAAEGRADRVVISVADRGPGIPEALRHHRFEQLAQADVSPGHRRGTGLGLSIVKRLVDGLHGVIVVESGPGAGTTISVDLPRATGSA